MITLTPRNNQSNPITLTCGQWNVLIRETGFSRMLEGDLKNVKVTKRYSELFAMYIECWKPSEEWDGNRQKVLEFIRTSEGFKTYN